MGEASLETRIAKYPTIVRATLNSTSSEVVGTVGHWQGKYTIVVKFNLSVHEYLNGNGPKSITAVWIYSGFYYNSRSDAEAARPGLVAQRDTSFDDREAIIFLENEGLSSVNLQGDNLYYIGHHTDLREGKDGYSLSNRDHKLWLPSVSTSSSTDGRRSATSREYLLAPPTGAQVQGRVARNETSTPPISGGGSGARSSSGTTPTITLTALKAQITAINSELAAGNSTAAYRKCVEDKYRYETMVEYAKSQGNDWSFRSRVSRIDTIYDPLPSGAPAGTVNFEQDMYGEYPNDRTRTWLEGGDADLFEVHYGPNRSRDRNNDGRIEAVVDGIKYLQSLRTIRPLPAGEYSFDLKDVSYTVKLCNHIITTPWTVTVAEHEHTLHEALFDPVTDGSAVAADSSNGQLEPAAFTDGNGASATIQRIEWASDAVKVKVSPHTGLAGHKLDIIELDGEVSLSLQVDNATVDATNGSLGWAVAEQPWEDGDLLMLRIKEILPEIALEGVPSTIRSGQSAPFTVHATGLSSSLRYTIRLSTDNDHLGFRDGCGTPYRTVSLPSNSTSHSLTDTLHGCAISSGTLSASLMQGATTVHSSTADVQVEQSINVTLTLSPREDGNVTRTDLTIEWTDPGNCDGNYFVGLYNSDGVVLRNLGHHSASETSMLQVELPTPWEDIPNDERSVRVTCAPNAGNWRIVGEVPLRSGLP